MSQWNVHQSEKICSSSSKNYAIFFESKYTFISPGYSRAGIPYIMSLAALSSYSANTGNKSDENPIGSSTSK